MATSIIRVTKGIQRVTSDGLVGIDQAVDVTGYHTARLALKIIGVENADSPHLVVAIQTSMTLDDPDNAPLLGGFVFSEEKGLVMVQTFPGLLRYLWFNASEFEGEGADAFSFSLEGLVYD